MMKIAVASEGKNVSEHFGHCGNFNLYNIQGGKVVHEESVASPGHGHGVLPDFLADLGATVVISGGMGTGAMDRLRERKIEVIAGTSGDAKEAVEKYINGELKSSGAVCQHHGHHGEHGDHGDHGHQCRCGR